MISLDQVYLLEQKVESAVAKIQQLQAENDALRSKCNELTNALSAKSEQLTSFESDQSQIENGIKKALDRLNAIENSVLKTASAALNNQVASPAQPQIQTQPQTQVFTSAPVDEPVFTPEEEPEITNAPSFDTMETTISADEFSNDSFNEDQPSEENIEEDSQDGLGFDIF